MAIPPRDSLRARILILASKVLVRSGAELEAIGRRLEPIGRRLDPNSRPGRSTPMVSRAATILDVRNRARGFRVDSHASALAFIAIELGFAADSPYAELVPADVAGSMLAVVLDREALRTKVASLEAKNAKLRAAVEKLQAAITKLRADEAALVGSIFPSDPS